MTILTLVCSNSTTSANPAGFKSTFRITLPHSIPVRKECRLISATCLQSTDAGGERLLSISIPWLQTAECCITGGSSNASATDVSAPALAYDLQRHASQDLLLSFVARADHQEYHGMNMTINTSTIPGMFDIAVKSGATGVGVAELKYLVLRFEIDPVGIF